MSFNPPEQEWKKGSAELLVLSLLEDQPRHGYDLSKLIQIRSGGALRFHVTSLYPLLHRLERQGWIEGRWVEKAEHRRRRYYTLTPEGRKVLRSKQKIWKGFVAVISRVTVIEQCLIGRFSFENELRLLGGGPGQHLGPHPRGMQGTKEGDE